jgi:hypothetical protein
LKRKENAAKYLNQIQPPRKGNNGVSPGMAAAFGGVPRVAGTPVGMVNRGIG